MYIKILIIFLLIQKTYASQIFKVHGGLSAGIEGEFTIQGETLEESVDYELEEVLEAIEKTAVILNENGKDTRSAVKTNINAKKKTVVREVEVLERGRRLTTESAPDGFKYNHMLPKNTSSTRIYLPNTKNVLIMDDETGNFTTFDGLFFKKLVPLLEDVSYLKNAVKIIGALLGLDLAQLEIPLISEKETYIFLERVKNGDIPIFVPGDMYVNNVMEVGLDEDDTMPQFCSAFRGNYSTANWVRNKLWKNMTGDNLNSTIEVEKGNQRWDTIQDTANVRNKAANKNLWNYTVYNDDTLDAFNGDIKSEVCRDAN